MGKIEIGPATKDLILPLLKQKRDEIDKLITDLEGGEDQDSPTSHQTVTTKKQTRGPGRPKKAAPRLSQEETGKRCYSSTVQAILRKANHPMDAKAIFHELQKGGYQTKYKKLEEILEKCVGDGLVLLKGGYYQLPEDQD